MKGMMDDMRVVSRRTRTFRSSEGTRSRAPFPHASLQLRQILVLITPPTTGDSGVL